MTSAAHLPRMTTLSRVGEIVRAARSRPLLHRPVRARRQARGAVHALCLQPRARPRPRDRARADDGPDPAAMVARGGRGRAPPARGRRPARATRSTPARCTRADLLAMIEGREAEPPETLEEWRAYVDGDRGRAGRRGRPRPRRGRQRRRCALRRRLRRGRRCCATARCAAPSRRRRAWPTAGRDWLREGRRLRMPAAALAAALPAACRRPRPPPRQPRARTRRRRQAGSMLAAATGRI